MEYKRVRFAKNIPNRYDHDKTTIMLHYFLYSVMTDNETKITIR